MCAFSSFLRLNLKKGKILNFSAVLVRRQKRTIYGTSSTRTDGQSNEWCDALLGYISTENVVRIHYMHIENLAYSRLAVRLHRCSPLNLTRWQLLRILPHRSFYLSCELVASVDLGLMNF